MNDVLDIGSSMPAPRNIGEAVASGNTMVQTGSKYQTALAVQQPRDLHAVIKRVEAEASIVGESFYYQWTVKNKDGTTGKINGVSIEGAMVIARNYGNCLITYDPTEETVDSYIFNPVFVDLETQFCYSRPFKMSKNFKVYGNMDSERKEDIRFQIGASKGARNVILKAVSAVVIDRAFRAAMGSVREKIEKKLKNKDGKTEIIAWIRKRAKELAIDESDICRKYSVASIDAFKIDDFVMVFGDITAIENGSEFANVIFPPEVQEKTPLKTKVNDLAEKTKGKETKPDPKKEETPKEGPADTQPKEPSPRDVFIQEWVSAGMREMQAYHAELAGKIAAENLTYNPTISIDKIARDPHAMAARLWEMLNVLRFAKKQSK